MSSPPDRPGPFITTGAAWAAVAGLASVLGTVVGLEALQPVGHRPDLVTPLLPSVISVLIGAGLWLRTHQLGRIAQSTNELAGSAAHDAATAVRQTNGELTNTVRSAVSESVTHTLAQNGMVDRRAQASAPIVPDPTTLMPYAVLPPGTPIPPPPVGPPPPPGFVPPQLPQPPTEGPA